MLTKILTTIKDFSMLSEGDRVLVALSGGADSSVLLDVLIKCAEELGISVCAAHLNHMLRGDDADRDESFVREKCEKYGIELMCERINISEIAAETGESAELCARNVRYDFLRRAKKAFCADRIATAHNANDNLETALFNLSRGGGCDGMCGIPPVRGDIIRPLIRTSRGEIEAYAKEHSISFCVDRTNAETVYSRNKIRHNVIPELLAVNSAAVENFSRSSEILRNDADYLRFAALEAAEKTVDADGSCSVKKLLKLHPALFGRVCEILAGKALNDENYVLEYRHISALRTLCESANPSGQLQLPRGLPARREYEKLVFGEKAQKKDLSCVPLVEGENIFGAYRVFVKKSVKTGKINNSLNTFSISCDRIQDSFTVRGRKTGDEIKLPSRPSKTLKKLFIENRIPKHERESIPVIACGGDVVAVYGIGQDARYLPQEGEEIYITEIHKGRGENDK